ncbi:unnamed protein product [Sphenostylis stenocarpa]|uniref:Uncharacterized protein n=1 Tax=Sphenostylis stenocarpa TaxID=92480 RepID=A0AA86SUE5_9FABA|nr:unnamed protein product [Sphenostylis stenocarpa]
MWGEFLPHTAWAEDRGKFRKDVETQELPYRTRIELASLVESPLAVALGLLVHSTAFSFSDPVFSVVQRNVYPELFLWDRSLIL